MSNTFVPTTFFSDEEFYPHIINNSVLFNVNKYLRYTPPGTGDGKKWTFSFWAKKAYQTNSLATIFAVSAAAGKDSLIVQDNYSVDTYKAIRRFYDGTLSELITDSEYRDYGSWYHFTYVRDTAQTTSSDREKLFVNGVEVTSFSTSQYLDQNAEGVLNSAQTHFIGVGPDSISNYYYAGYLAEIYFVDGQALTPSDFGTTINGVWVPINYTGTYGDNGFHLDFNDPSDLGNDVSGNDNDFTTVGLTSADQVKDTPTNNYPVLNPVTNEGSSTGVISKGNLTTSANGSGSRLDIYSTIAFPKSGKWYVEAKVAQISSSAGSFGLAQSQVLTKYDSTNTRTYHPDGNFFNGSSAVSYGSSYTTNDIIGMAFDADNGDLTFYKNGVSQGVADNSITFDECVTFMWETSTTVWDVNFGQKSWSYSPPPGYKALCTKNMPSDENPVKQETQMVTGGGLTFHDYDIQHSCYSDNTSNKLSRTITTEGNRKTWTFSAWYRFPNFSLDTVQSIFSCGHGTAENFLVHLSNAELLYLHEETGGSKTFRLQDLKGFNTGYDWHHIVINIDTTDATESNRARIWLDGVELTIFTLYKEYPALNVDTHVNKLNEIFYLFYDVNANDYTNMYLADVYFTDGTVYPASTFGEFKNGIWKPKHPGTWTLTYGTNGFHLDFSQPDSPGRDCSGNNNHFTASNLTADNIVKDSPTHRMSIIDYYQSVNNRNAGLGFTKSQDNRGWSSTMLVNSGRWYCEITFSTVGNALVGVGHVGYDWSTELGLTDGEIGWYQVDGTLRIDNTTGNLYGETFNNGDVLGIALDMETSRVYFSLNGVWQRGGTPETFGLPAATGLPNPCQILLSTHTSATVTGRINYGQYEFKHQPPSLYRPLGDSYEYAIDYGARFDGGTNSYLTKDYSSSGNRRKFTFSTWFKQPSLGGMKIFGTSVDSSGGAAISFDGDYAGLVVNTGISDTLYTQKTRAEFRDCKWHHLVWQCDTEQVTASDRMKIFVDGRLMEDYTGTPTYPPQNSDLDINTTTFTHYLGVDTSSLEHSIYLSESHFIDGEVVDPVYFGEFKNNYWVPKEYTGNYGSNGFYFNYANGSDLGNDVSGNNNDYTKVSGTLERVPDTPTNNYCVLDKYAYYLNGSTKDIGISYSGGIDWSSAASPSYLNGCYGTELLYSGKYYWEIKTYNSNTTSYGNWAAGVGDNTGDNNNVIIRSNGNTANYDSNTTSITSSNSYGSTISGSDTLCIAYDVDSNKLWFGKNGTWFSSGNPATGANPSVTLPYAGFRPYVANVDNTATARVKVNFGQTSFDYTPPAGFTTISSQNMTAINYTGDEHNILLDTDKAGANTVISDLGKSATFNSSMPNSAWRSILANVPIPDNAKSYWEVVVNTADVGVGVATADLDLETWPGYDEYGWMYNSYDGKKYHDGVGESFGDSVGAGSVIGIATQRVGGSTTLFFSKDGVWQYNPGYIAYSNITGAIYPVFGLYKSAASVSGSLTVNFGESGFYYPIPAGYKALNHKYNSETNDFKPFSNQWLPEEVSVHDYGFDLGLYTGNSTGQAKNMVNTNFKPDLIWIKNRTAGDSNVLLDNVRGWNREFRPNVDYSAGVTEFHEAFQPDAVQDVQTNKVILGTQSALYNTNNENHVMWYWKSNPKWGVEIIEFLGDGSTPRQIPHNLGKVPEFWFCRNRERDNADWLVYHKDMDPTIPQNKLLRLNTDAVVADSSSSWADTAPTSTYFTVGDNNSTNASGQSIMFYLFTSIDGFSKFGTYTGNNSTNGPFVYTGFRPALVITKGISSAKDWRMFDTKRLGYNNKNYVLRCAASTVEVSENSVVTFSNGFKLVSTDGNSNGSGVTFMYAAFAEQPMKYSNAR